MHMKAITADPKLIQEALDLGASIIGSTDMISVKGKIHVKSGELRLARMKLRWTLFGNQEHRPPTTSLHAHVIGTTTYHIMLVIGTHFQIHKKALPSQKQGADAAVDASRAFCHANLNRKLLIRVSQQNMDAFRRHGLQVPQGAKYLLALKAIYGTYDSGDLFFTLLMDVLITIIGFQPCPDDRCFMILVVGDDWVMLGVHVDDLPMISNNKELLSHVILIIYKHFDLGVVDMPMKEVLGASIQHHEALNGNITTSLNNSSKINKLIRSTGLQDLDPVYTPFPSKSKGGRITYEPPINNQTVADLEIRLPYKKIVGSLVNIAIIRPDIAVAVSQLGGKRNNPNENDYALLIHVIGYLKTTIKFERHFEKSLTPQELSESYGDATYNSEPNGKSRIAACHFVLGNLVEVTSKSKMTSSSNAGEIIATSNCCNDAIYIRRVARWAMKKLDNTYPTLDTPIPIYTDNSGAFKLSKPEHTTTKKTRHLDPKFFMVKDYQARGIVDVRQIPGGSSDIQKADFFTKHFGVTHFTRKTRGMGIYDPTA